jgi:hypothetical protein
MKARKLATITRHQLTAPVAHSHRHGWYPRRVRARRVCVDRREHQAGPALPALQLVPAPGGGPVRRAFQLGRGICHRHGWGRCEYLVTSWRN